MRTEKGSSSMTKETEQNSYAEVLKGRNYGQQESEIHSILRKQRKFNHDQPRQEPRRTTPQRRYPKYSNLFYGHFFIVLTLAIRLQIPGLMKEISKQEMIMWPQKISNVTNSTNMDTYLEILEV
jgi:hypothetical protein